MRIITDEAIAGLKLTARGLEDLRGSLLCGPEGDMVESIDANRKVALTYLQALSLIEQAQHLMNLAAVMAEEHNANARQP